MIEILGLLVPIVALSIPIVAIWTRHRRKLAEMQIAAGAHQTTEKAAQYAAKVQQLEDRVQVLERIVTDSGYDIATRIEALRDSRSEEERDTGVPLDLAAKEAR